jgi:hypothetical protein
VQYFAGFQFEQRLEYGNRGKRSIFMKSLLITPLFFILGMLVGWFLNLAGMPAVPAIVTGFLCAALVAKWAIRRHDE